MVRILDGMLVVNRSVLVQPHRLEEHRWMPARGRQVKSSQVN